VQLLVWRLNKGDQMTNDTSNQQQQSDVSREDIARRAHAIYEQRGGFPGAELDDWLQAESELREQAGSQDDKAA
jgi:hypothetical protein